MPVPGYFALSVSAVPVPGLSTPSPSIMLMSSLSALSASAVPMPGLSAPCLSLSAMPVAVPESSPLPFLSFVC